MGAASNAGIGGTLEGGGFPDGWVLLDLPLTISKALTFGDWTHNPGSHMGFPAGPGPG